MAGLPTKRSTASFWHTEPSKVLLGHRTTSQVPTEADVVIVGSGITGASAARYLTEDERAKGLKVLMLEAREACWGATGRASNCQSASLGQALADCVHVPSRMEDIANLFSVIPLPTSPPLR